PNRDQTTDGSESMAKYILAYSGGSVPANPSERESDMAAWNQWFGRLGEAVVDGGAPFGDSKTVSAGGSVNGKGKSALGGYSIVAAESLAGAAELAKG